MAELALVTGASAGTGRPARAQGAEIEGISPDDTVTEISRTALAAVPERAAPVPDH